MQITSSDIYWLTRLDGIKSVAFFLGAVCVISGLATLIFYCFKAWGAAVLNPESVSSNSDKSDAHGFQIAMPKLMKVSVPLFFVTLPLWVAIGLFVPTTKEYAAIKVVPVVLNNTVLSKTAKEDFGDLYALSMEWAKEELKAAVPEAKNAVADKVKEVVNDAVKSVTGTGEEAKKK